MKPWLRNWTKSTLLYLKKRRFNPMSGRVLVAVSGGLDSMALLHFWRHYAGPLFNNSVQAAHVDHGLRRASSRDRAFVEEICGSWEIPLHAVALDPGTRGPRESVEMWGRRMRYGFFESVCRTGKIDWVLTAHHLDDQVETLFMGLCRAAEVRGLQGIHFLRKPNIVRPFLNRRRVELAQYAAIQGLKWREDESNGDLRFLRNRFRLKVIPRWIKKYGDPAHSILKITMNMQEVWPVIEKQRALAIAADNRGPGISFAAVQYFRENEPETLRGLLNALAEKEGIVLKASFFREFFSQWQRSHENLNVQADSIHCLRGSHGRLRFVSRREKPCGLWDSILALDLSGDGKSVLFEWGGKPCRLIFSRFAKPPHYSLDKSGGWRAFLDGKKIPSTLTLRKRRKGDKFAPLGVPSRKRKLKMYFISIGLPVEKRDSRMLICRENTVVWIPGIQISDFFKVTDNTREILQLEIQCPK